MRLLRTLAVGLFACCGAAMTAQAQYCNGTAGRCNGGIQQIVRVTTGTMDHQADALAGSGATSCCCYQDFTAFSTGVFQGQSYPITVNVSVSSGSNLVTAWVDWNQDSAWGVAGSGEQFVLTASGTTFSGTLSVPAGAAVGPTRMRVRLTTLAANNIPCGVDVTSSSLGGVQDFTIVVNASTSGACCAADGSCTIVSSGSCAGTYMGNLAACAPTSPCANAGACCAIGGTCTATLNNNCTSPSTFMAGAACETLPCAGRCCDNTTGVCVIAFNGAGCACGQTWTGYNTTCTPAPCGQGACCAETTGACSLTTLVGCPGSPASLFLGVGSVCSPNPCPGTGACCDRFTGACSTSTNQPNCSAGRVFMGVGTTCTPANACGGSCCNSTTGACTTPATGALCTASGGTSFTVGGVCSPLPCVGACCNISTGACTTMTSTGCAAATTVFRGLGSVCAASTCAGACCNIATRACTLISATTGCGTNITFMGLGSACPGGNICAGACCDATTRACTMSLAGACPSGSTMTGTTCSPDTCPAGVCCSAINGACAVKTAAGCTGTNAYFGTATACTSFPCAGACCDAQLGGCVVTGATNCTSSGTSVSLTTSSFYGVGTTCSGTSGGCANAACCKPDGTCVVMDSLDCAAVGHYLGSGVGCPAGVCRGEVDSATATHNTRAAALGPWPFNPGDVIVGGAASLDRYSIIPGGTSGPGIYKHVITRSSLTQSQTMSLVGQFQFDNHSSSESNFATSSLAGGGSNPLVNQMAFYSFGNGPTVDLLVQQNAGSFLGAASIAPYTLTISTTQITGATPTSVATPLIDLGVLPGGLMTFSTVGETATDTDIWVFDSNFSPITGWGSDDAASTFDHALVQSEVKKDVSQGGVYYLAIGTNNLGVNALTPLGDRFQSKAFLDLPGYVASAPASAIAPPVDVSFKVVDGAGVVHHAAATQYNYYDVVWVKMTITAPATGACCIADGTCIVVSQSGCVGLYASVGSPSGDYRGDGVACPPTTASQPDCAPPFIGACCQGDGSCVLGSAYGCTTYPGAFRGNGTTCASAACARSIVTPYVNTNSFSSGGIFVDVTAPADHGVTITRFDYRPSQAYNNATPYPVLDVFVRPSGTYQGHEMGPYVGNPPAGAFITSCGFDTPSDWVFNGEIRTIPYPVGGSDSQIAAVLTTPVTVPAGTTVGLYLLSRAGGISTTTQTSVDGFAWSNADLSILSHVGRSLASNNNPGWGTAVSTTNQSFHGRIYYTLVNAGVCCRGSTCNASVSAANCTPSGTAGAQFSPSATACNASGNFTSPCCHADYNKSGTIGVQDIFDYLNSWFAGSPYADFGGDGTNAALNVQNIFDFLNAWFAGGC